MVKSFKKVIAISVSVFMAASVFTFGDSFVYLDSVVAADNVYEGMLSDTASWKLDAQGILTIYGTGSISGSGKFDGYNVRKLVVESGITSIGSDMFRDSTRLESVMLPDTLTHLGDYVFEGCLSLKSIEIPENNSYFVTEDGVLYDKDKRTLIVYPAARETESFAIPQGVIEVKEYAFDYVSGLKNVIIPESLKSFGAYAPFYKAVSIFSFQVDSNNAYFSSIDGDLYSKDGKRMIRYAMGKENDSITVKDFVEVIADEAFSGSEALSEIVFGSNVKTIGDGILNDCKSLTEIMILNPDCSLGELIQKGLSDFNSNIVIYSYEDSTAAKYAKEYEWNFKAMIEKEVESISVNTLPKKMTFALNDKFNHVGLEILIKYTDGSSLTRSGGFTVDGYDATRLGKQEITITYKGAVAKYDIEVVEQLEYETINVGDRTQVDIIEGNQVHYLSFVPDVSAIYDFYALSNSDTYGAIYDADGHLLAENDDKGDAENGDYIVDFYISHHLDAGKIYLLAAKYQMEDELGSFDVIIKRHEDVGPEETTIPEETTGQEETTTPEEITTPEETISPEETTATEQTTIPEYTTTPQVTTKVPVTTNAVVTKPTVKPTTKAPVKITVKKTKVKSASKKKTAKKAKITLKKIKGVTGYEVKISTSSKFKKSKTITKKFKKTAFTFKSSKIKNKKKLYIKARAYKKVNGKTYYSSWSGKKKIKIKK